MSGVSHVEALEVATEAHLVKQEDGEGGAVDVLPPLITSSHYYITSLPKSSFQIKCREIIPEI